MKKTLIVAIFDLDGLILDSEVFYAKAWTDAFNSNSPKEYRVQESAMMEWFYTNLSGKKIGQQIDNIQHQFKYNDIPKIYEEYRKLFKERLEYESIEVKKGFFELISYLKSRRIRLAIASTSSAETIKKVLTNANIDDSLFEIIVSGDMGVGYKPSPDPYLKVCEILNVCPKNVIAFEDSESGVLSATNAKIDCFLIPGRAPVAENVKKKAYFVCDNLSDTISIIKKLSES